METQLQNTHVVLDPHRPSSDDNSTIRLQAEVEVLRRRALSQEADKKLLEDQNDTLHASVRLLSDENSELQRRLYACEKVLNDERQQREHLEEKIKEKVELLSRLAQQMGTLKELG